jgi:hypothetical protein
MTQQKENYRETVEVEVVGHEIHNGQGLTKLTIPAWGGSYPTSIYGTTPEVQQQLPTGATLFVLLERGNIKRKDGVPRDGTQPYHWFWNFISVADGPTLYSTEPVQPPPVDDLFGGPTQSAPPVSFEARRQNSDMLRQSSIERQVAFKEARIIMSDAIASGKTTTFDYDALNDVTNSFEAILNRSFIPTEPEMGPGVSIIWEDTSAAPTE